ncbi:hypothetical protein N7540_012916 [Penicillium herquei]|nr:hypothetical protein N7540_012916 [Penicillium herquei]
MAAGDEVSEMDAQMARLRAQIGGLRKRRQLIELQSQVAEEERLLQEAEDKLNAARTQSCEGTPAPSVTPLPDTSSMVAAFIESVVSPHSEQVPPIQKVAITTGGVTNSEGIHPVRAGVVASGSTKPVSQPVVTPKQTGQVKTPPTTFQSAKRPAVSAANGVSPTPAVRPSAASPRGDNEVPPAKIQKVNPIPSPSPAKIQPPREAPTLTVKLPAQLSAPIIKPAVPTPVAPNVAAQPPKPQVNAAPKPIPSVTLGDGKWSKPTLQPPSKPMLIPTVTLRDNKFGLPPLQRPSTGAPTGPATPVKQVPSVPAVKQNNTPSMQTNGQVIKPTNNEAAPATPDIFFAKESPGADNPVDHNPALQVNKAYTFPPPPPKVGIYQASKWDECQRFLAGLDEYFLKFPTHYAEDEPRVELGARLLAPQFRNPWIAFAHRRGRSWKSYLTFLAHALARNSNERTATMLFSNGAQFANQPVRHFALWLIQWEPHLPNFTVHDHKLRLLNGILPSVRAKATKPHTEFNDYISYTVYLQVVENSIPDRVRMLSGLTGNLVPAKLEDYGITQQVSKPVIKEQPKPLPQVRPAEQPKAQPVPQKIPQPMPQPVQQEAIPPTGPRQRSPPRQPKARSPSRPRLRSPPRARSPSRNPRDRSPPRYARDHSPSRYPRDRSCSRNRGRSPPTRSGRLRSPSRPATSRRYRSPSPAARPSYGNRSPVRRDRSRSPRRRRTRSPSKTRYRSPRRSRERTPEAPRARTPPTGPRSQSVAAGRQTPGLHSYRISTTPPHPPVPNYNAVSWWEFRNFTGNIEVHFKKFPNYYDDEHKIEAGKHCLHEPLLARWNAYANRLSRVSWLTFCTFLVQLLPPDGTEQESRKLYCNVRQGPGQSLRDFVFLMLRYAKCWNTKDHNRLLHLWERIHSSIKDQCSRTWRDFEDFHDFVTYLQSVESGVADSDATVTPAIIASPSPRSKRPPARTLSRPPPHAPSRPPPSRPPPRAPSRAPRGGREAGHRGPPGPSGPPGSHGQSKKRPPPKKGRGGGAKRGGRR